MRPNVLLYGAPSTVDFGGASVRIKTDWRVWVRVQMLMDDPDLPDGKAGALLLDAVFPRNLAEGEDRPPYMEAMRHPKEAVGAAVSFMRMGQPARPKTAAEKHAAVERTWDWGWDSSTVIADFQRFYGIDLTDPSLRMHWWRFWSLFCGMPGDESESMRLMAVRAADESKLKGDEKRLLMDSKARAMLPARTEEERRRNRQIRYGV